MFKLLKNLLRRYALRTGKLKLVYMKICRPSSVEFARFMRLHGGLHFVGENVCINIGELPMEGTHQTMGGLV